MSFYRAIYSYWFFVRFIFQNITRSEEDTEENEEFTKISDTLLIQNIVDINEEVQYISYDQEQVYL